MKYVIAVSGEINHTLEWPEMKTEFYYSMILTTIVPKRKGISRQIVLTDELEEAELFDNLISTQSKVKELQSLNSNYDYTIVEVKVKTEEEGN